MKIIADSGSTKTHWVVSEGSTRNDYFSDGINPYFMNADEISRLLADTFSGLPAGKIDSIIFYGAGCSLPEKCEIVRSGLSGYFSKADIEVHSDLLASAHALFGNKAGVACILGTGSNAAVFDGEKFIQKIRSLGYMLGDEGSGSYIGRQLLQAWFRNEMPEVLQQEFAAGYQTDTAKVLEALYNKPFPNRYLASFTPFASKHSDKVFIQNLMRNAFRDFIRYQLATLTFDKQLPIGFVGSVAFYFQDILKEELQKSGYTPGPVLQAPMEALVKYYLD